MSEPDQGESWRLFFAAMLPPDLVEAVRRNHSRARFALPRGVRWTNPEQAHLTLAFLGDVLCEHVPQLVDTLGSFAAAQQPLTFDVKGLGAFPDMRRPRVIWAGLEGPERDLLFRWHAELWQATAHLRLDQSRAQSRFHPHITLGRVPGSQPPKLQAWMARHVEWPLGHWRLDELVLVRSILTDQGAIYEPVAMRKLLRTI
ncbi:MAG: RNA 2',3'-cyclic phosphodiesterase [bacterium]